MMTTSVFSNNRCQAVRLPAEMRLPQGTTRVRIVAKGEARIITPIGKTWESFFSAPNDTPKDFMPERASQQQSDRESL